MKFEKFRYLFFVVLGAILLSAGLNVLLIPGYKAVGTAISTMISFTLLNGLIYLKSRQIMKTALSGNASKRIIFKAAEIVSETEVEMEQV